MEISAPLSLTEPGGGKAPVHQLSGGACGAAGEKPQLQRELQTLPAGLGEASVHGPPQQLDVGEVTASCPLPVTIILAGSMT